jgi:hypothetical protein
MKKKGHFAFPIRRHRFTNNIKGFMTFKEKTVKNVFVF